ncbi:hypothetical protein MKX01_010447, partial [Papaver californicum]
FRNFKIKQGAYHIDVGGLDLGFSENVVTYISAFWQIIGIETNWIKSKTTKDIKNINSSRKIEIKVAE